jgi:uncharacterized membrane protein
MLPVAQQATSLERAVHRWSVLAYVLALAAYLAWMHQTHGSEGLLHLAGLAGSSLLLLGKFIVFAGLKEGQPRPWELAILVFLLDLSFGFLLTSRAELLERIPLVGRGLRLARRKARLALVTYPGLARQAFLGVALYVFLPLAATGAITGALVARVLGLSRLESLSAIALGSATTSTLFALLATLVGTRAEEFLRSPVLAGGSTLLLGLVVWHLYRRGIQRLKVPG